MLTTTEKRKYLALDSKNRNMRKEFLKTNLFLVGWILGTLFFVYIYPNTFSIAYAQERIFTSTPAFDSFSQTSANLLVQPISNTVFGAEISIVQINVSMPAGGGSRQFGILKFNTATNTVTAILTVGTQTISGGATPVTTNFTLPSNVVLSPLSSERYAFFVNFTNVPANLIGDFVGASDPYRSNTSAITPTYVGTTLVTSGSSFNYVLFGSSAPSQNSTSTKTFTSSFGGQGYTLTTDPLTFDSDCSSGFNVRLTHSFTLFNGSTNATQSFLASSELIQPPTLTFANGTLINWTNQASRSQTLSFLNPAGSGYSAGQTVQARCSGLLSDNVTFVTSSCSVNIQCAKQLILETSIFDTPTVPITDNLEFKINEIVSIFATPIFIFTIIMVGVASGITAKLRSLSHSGVIFMSVILAFTLVYIFIGVYPFELALLLIIIAGFMIVRTVLPMFRGT